MITKKNELAKLGDAIAISKSEGSLVKDQTFYGFFSSHPSLTDPLLTYSSSVAGMPSQKS